MDRIRIVGGKQAERYYFRSSGAKNAALPLMIAGLPVRGRH